MDHRDEETYAIIGAAMEVHRHLGCGFLESIYREALCRELEDRGISFRTEVPLRVFFKGLPLVTSFRVDLICFEGLLVELKALRAVGDGELAQTINYLKASGLKKALLINFGARSLEHRRVILSSRLT